MSEYYVYEHWRLDLDACFYVGKGKGRRAFYRPDRNKHWRRVVDKLGRTGSAWEVRMIVTDVSEDEALTLEIERIAFWRAEGVKLTNLTDGGDGVSGYKFSLASRARMSERLRGNTHARGYRHTEETKAAYSAARRGKKITSRKPVSDETRAKLSAAHKGRKLSAETRAKMSLAQRGENHPMFGKRGTQNPNYGREHTAAARENMRAGQIERFRRERNDA